jgi:hypothetical protein
MNVCNMLPRGEALWECLAQAIACIQGVRFTDPARADTLLCDSRQMPLPNNAAKLIYGFERLDGAQIVSRTFIAKSAHRLVKMYCATPAQTHCACGQAPFRRLHVPVLAEGSLQFSGNPLDTAVTDEAYARVRLGASFLHLPPVKAVADRYRAGVPDWGARDIDLLMVGTASYGQRPDIQLIERHRQKAIADVAALSGKYRVVAQAGRPFSRATWLNMLGRARIVVSPWGLGEACHRDYEGVLAGCRVLKPRTPYLIRSSCQLLELQHDAIIPVPPMDMLAIPELDALLQSEPSDDARRQLLARQSPEWLGKHLTEMWYGDEAP